MISNIDAQKMIGIGSPSGTGGIVGAVTYNNSTYGQGGGPFFTWPTHPHAVRKTQEYLYGKYIAYCEIYNMKHKEYEDNWEEHFYNVASIIGKLETKE